MAYLAFINELCEKWKVEDDCRSMIVLDFLLYDNEKLNELHRKKEMKFWLVRFIKNYWFSKNSRYYYQYNKYYEWNEELKPEPDED